MDPLDGIYLITFRGAADWGIGMLVLQNGVVTGADAAGVLYDGDYEAQGSLVNIELRLTVPAGVSLVQGTPVQPKTYTVPAKISVDRNAFDSQETVLLELPPGPVNVIFQRLRSLNV